MTAKFEGPEKRLDIILKAPETGLRADHDDHRWHRVVQASRADILSRISNTQMDAYLLSESSLFVWPSRLLMITCGYTTLIEALPVILKEVGSRNVAFVGYERKNYTYPDRQIADFEIEAARLLKHFDGKSYRLGPANFDHVHLFYAAHGDAGADKSPTLKILMHDLDPRCMQDFQDIPDLEALSGSRLSRLETLYPGARTDSHLFSPPGYSVNGIRGRGYYAVHVTPLPGCSYASFETNIPETDYSAIVDTIIAFFSPERFTLMLTTGLAQDYCQRLHDSVQLGTQAGWRITEKSRYTFDAGLAVSFRNYVRTAQ